MNITINICDKCGKVVDFPDELKLVKVSYIRDTTYDWEAQLCSVCKQEFSALRETFTVAKHILEKEEK